MNGLGARGSAEQVVSATVTDELGDAGISLLPIAGNTGLPFTWDGYMKRGNRHLPDRMSSSSLAGLARSEYGWMR